MSGSVRILIVRPDRIGDVILSTPVVAELKRLLPAAEIWMCVRSEIAEILGADGQFIPGLSGVLPFEATDRHAGISGALRLAGEIRRMDFATAIVLQDTRAVSWAVALAGVPVRVGPRSRLRSYFLFNRGLRQHRSEARCHEAEYNLELLTVLGLQPVLTRGTSKVVVTGPGRTAADAWLQKHSVTGRYALVHPGMRGSAPNWPVAAYQNLVRGLSERKIPVLCTFGPGEESLKREFMELAPCYGGAEAGGLSVQAALCERAAFVVAPSTGPLHLAVALGRKVVTFYPPFEAEYRVQSAERWGPWALSSQARVLVAPRVENGMLAGIDANDVMTEVVKAYESAENR